MGIIPFAILMLAVGALIWFIKTETLVPVDASMRQIAVYVVIFAVIVWLLALFGLLPDLNSIRIGR